MSDEAQGGLPPLPVFGPEEKVCGTCKLWQPHSVDARGWVGPCRLQEQRGLFPPSAPICDAFVARHAAAPARPEIREHAPRQPRSVAPLVVRHTAEPAAAPSNVAAPPHAPRPVAGGPGVFDFGGGLTMTREEVLQLFREAAGDVDAPPLAAKWEGGVVQLLPKSADLQGKEIPVDSLFHKIVMIRDRLRTLEQKINANPKLTDGEKVELQHYVTRCYGSLTTFNVLFRDKEDHFVGQKGEE